MKAKTNWMAMGLWQQGRSAPFEAKGFGPREDWSKLWTAGATQKKKVVKKGDTRWEDTRDGRVRIISSPERTDVRTNSVDVYQQEIAPGGVSAKHWHMADEAVYVMSGKGHSLHWDVEAEIAEKYYARIAEKPSRWEFGAGDVLYIPQNTVHQHMNHGDEPLLFLSAQNRLFKQLGYDNVVYLEDASAGTRKQKAAATA
jgi:quercetin dioxygenase-like cupin family protein